jgi:N4-gp56 family major capsid protein
LTARHNIVERTIYLLGLHSAEIYDQLVFNVLDAATTNYRPNNKANDTSLVGSDHIGYVDFIENDAALNANGGKPFESGEFVLLCGSQVYAAILKDPDWKASNQFAAPEKIWRGEVGALGGFRVVRSNSPALAATAQAGSGQADKVYTSFAIARNAYQITDLQNLRVYVVAPGGQTDPLQQSRKIGYKFAFKTLITNQNWLIRMRSAGLSSVTNP